MKIAPNLERIADQATSIARRSRKLNEGPELEEVKLLEPMAREALAMFRDSVRAYTDGNMILALEIRPRDRHLDLLNKQVSDKLTERIVENPQLTRHFLDLITIARFIERVGDHAKNIAEDAVYATQGEDIRHIRNN